MVNENGVSSGMVKALDAGKLNIVVAHSLEAKPLIALFNLEKVTDHTAFPIYKNDKGISLVLSGMGKAAATDASNYLGTRLEPELISAWLNIGIAGHRSAAIGTGLLASKITEKATGDVFYPGMLISGYDSLPVITVDEIEKEYDEDVAYEMEASGFYRAAQALSSSEFVQTFKIISDNRDNHVDQINLQNIPGMIERQGSRILELVGDLLDLLDTHNSRHRLPKVFGYLESAYKLTVTQRIQLKRHCQRFQAQDKNGLLEELSKKNYHSTKQLLSVLEKTLD